MADNTIIIGGAIQPSTINTPGDKRERVSTFDEIYSIDNPAVGGTVWVEDEQKEYRIISLKPKVIGGMEVADGAVDEVVPESEIIARGLTSSDQAIQDVAESIAQNEASVNAIVGAVASRTMYDEEAGTLVLL